MLRHSLDSIRLRRGRPLAPLVAILLSAAIACRTGPEEAVDTDPTWPPAWAVAVESIQGDAIRAHMSALADDGMEGREAGTPGYDRAAAYVADRFQASGLSTCGELDGHLQPIDFLESRLVDGSTTLRFERDGRWTALTEGDEFVRTPGFGETVEELHAPLVFVGHGMRAPEYGHDDFAGVDVTGSVLVVLSGAPPHFAPTHRAYYSSGLVKRWLAAALGARGILTIRTPVDSERRPWELYRGLGERPALRWVGADGLPFRGHPDLPGSALLSQEGAAELFALAGRDLGALFERHAGGETGAFEMGVSVRTGRTSTHRSVVSSNVLACLPGSDPSLAREILVYTAHLDHLGISSGEPSLIHNGAYDNAAGVAILLETAKAMARLRPRPRRTVLFAALTAEEKGLRGSSYLARNRPAGAGTWVANLNVDMPYLGFPVGDVEAFGAEHSTLAEAVGRATRDLGLVLSDDSLPAQVRFVRSDQFSFVQEGIPALALKPGSISTDPSIDGAERLAAFLGQHYHRPSDDLDLEFSSEGATRFARAVLLTGLYVTEDDEAPSWHPGDFFASKFAQPEGAPSPRQER